jgi:predicted DNA binding protein
LLAVDFSIYHHGCPASESTERFPDIFMRILSSNPYGKNKASVLQIATSQREEDLSDFLSFWRHHNVVTNLRVVERKQGLLLFDVDLKFNGGWVTRAILDHNAFFSNSIPVTGGIEKWSVLVEEENKSSLFSQLDGVGVVRINRIKRLKLGENAFLKESSVLSELSGKQLHIVKTALENGYFDCPRLIDSRELAKKVGMAQSTLLEHLRKAQFKILRDTLDQATPR